MQEARSKKQNARSKGEEARGKMQKASRNKQKATCRVRHETCDVQQAPRNKRQATSKNQRVSSNRQQARSNEYSFLLSLLLAFLLLFQSCVFSPAFWRLRFFIFCATSTSRPQQVGMHAPPKTMGPPVDTTIAPGPVVAPASSRPRVVATLGQRLL